MRIDRRRALRGVLAMALAASAGAQSQPAGKKARRIGVLLVTSRKRPDIHRLLVPFEQALRGFGYVEGRNLQIEWREAEGRLERLPALAAELVARRVELIVAGAGQAAVAAKEATSTIPIVFVASNDPVGFGLVKNLARPESNVTGFTTWGKEAARKQLELLREVLPRARRIAVLHSSGETASDPQIEELREASALLALEMQLYDVKGGADLEGVLGSIERDRPDGLHVLFTVATYLHRRRIAEYAAAHRLPAVYGYSEFVEVGGLASYGFGYADNWRRTAAYVDRILKGEKPRDLPVQQPQSLELAVNLKAARALGIAIPQSVLLRASQVIE
jgi:putative ABC transport system substrate-binding protein